MGTLYRNGIPYVGSGGAGGVEVTQAEYDALPTSEKMNGSIYFITDGSVSYPTASQMRYDNTESGIPSTSVQGAIDELKIEIGDTDISTIGDGTVTGAVDELNNGLSLQNVEVTNQRSGTSLTARRFGNVVELTGDALNIPSGTWTTLGQCAPAVMSATFTIANSDFTRVAGVRIIKTGAITIYHGAGATLSFYGVRLFYMADV